MKSKATNVRSEISPARSAAFDILLRVDREGSYASELLHSWRHEGLNAADHSLTTEIVMGVLRWQSALDSEIAIKSSPSLAKLDREVLIALRLGFYQLRQLDRIPSHAAINESVELVKRSRKRSAAAFVNAVLRKLAEENSARVKRSAPGANSPSAANIAATWAHPLWLVERWQQSYGIETALEICRYDQSIPNTAIRLRNSQPEEQLRGNIKLIPGTLLSSARIVRGGEMIKSTALHQGRYVIQDEASQLVTALIGHGISILDCCAAPGGKTLAVADHNPNAGIVALELHPHRARLLKKLLKVAPASASGSGNVHVVAGDARNPPISAKFERVLADVPCSGTGTLARNPEIKWRLKLEDLADLQTRQIAILRSAMRHVAAGGRLIYCTCSLEKEENEDVIDRALADDSSFGVLDSASELERLRQQGELVCPAPDSLTTGPFLRTIPGIHPCDGFFAAILQKA